MELRAIAASLVIVGLISLACGQSGGPSEPAAPAPVPATASVEPAPAEPAPAPAAEPAGPPADPLEGWTQVDPFEALTSGECSSFRADGTLSAETGNVVTLDQNEKSSGTWKRSGDRLDVTWTETVEKLTSEPPDPETWSVASTTEHSASYVLHRAWTRKRPDEEGILTTAMILATQRSPDCTECSVLIDCADMGCFHMYMAPGDCWFGPRESADVWVEVIDAGGGPDAVAVVKAVVADTRATWVFPGGPAKTPRAGVEVLHREHPRATEAATAYVEALKTVGTNVTMKAWADAPHPVVIAVGPLR